MARGLLVSFAGLPVMPSSLFPDNGLASLAGALIAAGHEVEILDFNRVSLVERLVPPSLSCELATLYPDLVAGGAADLAEELLAVSAALDEELEGVTEELAEELIQKVAVEGIDFVGFKLWSGDGFTASLRIAERLRRQLPEVHLFAGGPAVLFCQEVILELTGVFEALVDGEGEAAIVELARVCDGTRELDEVPNVIYRQAGQVVRTGRHRVEDLDELPFPRYDAEVYPGLDGDEKIALFVIDESRGCPRGCGFCIHQKASGASWRLKSPWRVVDEVALLNKLSGVGTFRLAGSFAPAKFLIDFSRQYGATGLGGRFSGFAHPMTLPMEQVDELRAAGCTSLFFGVESFVDANLKGLAKKGSARRARASIRSCQEVGIVPVVSLIVPSPGQTEAQREVNRRAIEELAASGPLAVVTQCSVLTPRTGWWREREAFGFRITTSEDEYRRVLATYKLRPTLPPTLWEPLPFELDGVDFSGLTRINSQFQRHLRRLAVPVGFPDEHVLIADACGAEMTELERDIMQLFFTFDARQMRRFVARVNDALRSS